MPKKYFPNSWYVRSGGRIDRRATALGLLLGTTSKSGKTWDKFSIQIMNEKEQRKTRKEAFFSSIPHNAAGQDKWEPIIICVLVRGGSQ